MLSQNNHVPTTPMDFETLFRGGQWLREAGGTLFLCKGGGRFAVLDKGGGRIYSATL